MTNLNKIGFTILLTTTAVFFAGCDFSNSKKPRNSTTVSENSTDNTAGNDSADNSELTANDVSDSDNSSANDTGKNGGGQTVVEFAKGNTSRTYKNSIGANDTQTYILKVSAGQSLTAKISSPQNKAYFRVKTPGGKFTDDGSDIPGFLDLLDETLKESGNYKIIVYPKKEATNYNIMISVTGGGNNSQNTPSQGGDFTKTVKFPKGKSSASYNADYNAVGPDNQTYILGASGGQTMTVTLNNSRDVAFTIVSPGGKTLANQTTSYTGTLPEDGNYKITIDPNTAKIASYRINFAIR